jgi:uncharacterized protein
MAGKSKKLSKKWTPGNFKLRVGKSKTGKGLFALEPIPKGACITEYVGRRLGVWEQHNKDGKYFFETGKHTMIDGNVKRNIARFINHSCKPNCEADGPARRVFIMAIKNIKAGEELTYHYGEEYFDEHIKPKGCLCQKCRKKKTSPIG